ncbi:hypothetical protein BKA70DRAFT_235390 [Coprinopsis sp. MPI-PUGE-AT-0042]|nr:hypothetical protein BKA70DRAFT_235390 [Coprinopsis sp. MPI-PUGE-AT-0042]
MATRCIGGSAKPARGNSLWQGPQRQTHADNEESLLLDGTWHPAILTRVGYATRQSSNKGGRCGPRLEPVMMNRSAGEAWPLLDETNIASQLILTGDHQTLCWIDAAIPFIRIVTRNDSCYNSFASPIFPSRLSPHSLVAVNGCSVLTRAICASSS